MDESVKAALARWPDVPAAFGWLSLDARGHWHLHAEGLAAEGGVGESITNPQIIEFIQRNFTHDDHGRWFFQNGPQRVFVRIDAAPFILRRADTGDSLVTHTGQPVGAVRQWWLADGQTLFADTDVGPGVIEDRELTYLLDVIRTDADTPLGDWLAAHAEHAPLPAQLHLPGAPGAPLRATTREKIGLELGFEPNPKAA